MTFAFNIAALAQLVRLIEGPYKWYIIGGVIVIITILVSRVVFKTLKWLLLLGLLAILIFAVGHYLGYF